MIHSAGAKFTSYLNIALGLLFEMTPSSCHTSNQKLSLLSFALAGFSSIKRVEFALSDGPVLQSSMLQTIIKAILSKHVL